MKRISPYIYIYFANIKHFVPNTILWSWFKVPIQRNLLTRRSIPGLQWKSDQSSMCVFRGYRVALLHILLQIRGTDSFVLGFYGHLGILHRGWMKISLQRLFDDLISYTTFDFQNRQKVFSGEYVYRSNPPSYSKMLQFVWDYTLSILFHRTSRRVSIP